MNSFPYTTQIARVTTRHNQAKRIFMFFERISASTAMLSGDAFFKMLVSEIASILQVRTVFVSRYPGVSAAYFRTIAFWQDGHFVPNVDFEIEGRPCKYVLEGDVCFYPRNLEALFPREGKTQSFIGLPLVGRDQQVIGHIAILHNQPLRGDERDYIAPLRIFAARAAMELERDLLWDALQVHEEHYRILSRDLHDAVSQTLWIANMLLEKLPEELHGNVAQAEERIWQLRQMMQAAHAELRMLMLELRPSELEDVGLRDLILNLADTISVHNDLTIQVNYRCEREFQSLVKTNLYRIVHEALSNIVRHAHAESALIEVLEQGDAVLLTIEDDGEGFDLTAVSPTHMGSVIMRERADVIGAHFKIRSDVNGTRIEVLWRDKF